MPVLTFHLKIQLFGIYLIVLVLLLLVSGNSSQVVLNKCESHHNSKNDVEVEVSSFSGRKSTVTETQGISTNSKGIRTRIRTRSEQDVFILQIIPSSVLIQQTFQNNPLGESSGRNSTPQHRKISWNCKGSKDKDVFELSTEIYQNQNNGTIFNSREKGLMGLRIEIEFLEGNKILLEFMTQNLTLSVWENSKSSHLKMISGLDQEFCFRLLHGIRINDSPPILDLEAMPNKSDVNGQFGKGHNNRSTSTLTHKFQCFYHTPKPERGIQDIYIGLLVTAAAFLLVTVIVYVITWDHHSLHGWTIFSEVLCNFFMILTTVLAHLYVRDSSGGPPSFGCLLIATLSHFFFISTFSWMTIINFNLWRTFRNRRVTKKLVHFLCYATFAFGVPLAFVILGVTMDTLHSRYGEWDPVIAKFLPPPHYGNKFCFVTKKSQGVYIYYPIGTLIVTNVVLFGLTAYSLYRHHQETKVLHSSSQKESNRLSRSGNNGSPPPRGNENYIKSVTLFVKLFCVMGVSWIFEVFAWAFSQSGKNVPLYWIIFDVANLLQAIAIFIIFVCKRKVLRDLKRKWKGFCGQS